MNFTLASFRASLEPMPATERIAVAFSGGVDSVVLLHALHLLQSGKNPPRLRALHVNHGLQAEADAWQDFCAGFCRQRCIPLQSVKLAPERIATGENGARQARYEVFARALEAGEGLLLAHHLDDQLETLLLRLMRGAGPQGLSGMPVQRALGGGFLYRPLLDFSRRALTTWAVAEGLEWVEDASNADTALDRNYCRRELLPRIEQRWPDYRDNWRKSMVLSREADELLRELAAADLQSIATDTPTVIDHTGLARLSPPRQRNVLRHWLGLLGPGKPGWHQLQRLSRELLAEDASDGLRLPVGEREVWRFRDELHARLPVSHFDASPRLPWDAVANGRLQLEDNGCLQAGRETGNGIVAGCATALEVRYRQGGESIRLPGRPARPLKKLLREQGIAPWLRRRIPLLYHGDELAAVPGIGAAEAFAVRAEESGYSFRWLP